MLGEPLSAGCLIRNHTLQQMVMPSTQTEVTDGKGEAGEAVDEDVGGEEDEELGGDGDVANQSYTLHRRKVTCHKKQWK